MNFAKRFTEILDSKGITPYRMSKDTGIPEATIGRWKNGKAIPNGEMLKIVVAYLEITADYLLLGKEQKNKPITSKEDDELINLFEQLPMDKKQEAVNYLRYLIEHREK